MTETCELPYGLVSVAVLLCFGDSVLLPSTPALEPSAAAPLRAVVGVAVVASLATELI